MSDEDYCKKCGNRLNNMNVCPQCGWSYDKEFKGQMTLMEEESVHRKPK